MRICGRTQAVQEQVEAGGELIAVVVIAVVVIAQVGGGAGQARVLGELELLPPFGLIDLSDGGPPGRQGAGEQS
ncbi:hypothetical protein ACIRD4_29890 [Streptomyces clavifer]|uniref:hypothetical protein n=1 Tax=Streptomyces clavifer TaxID=68188 RepID=UPI003820FFF2